MVLIVGAFFVYGRAQIVFWWFFHASVLMYGIFWPLKYQRARYLGWIRYLHVFLTVAGITLPLIPTIIYLFTAGYGVNLVRNYSCVPGDDDVTLNNLTTAFLGTISLTIFMLIGVRIYMAVSDQVCVLLVSIYSKPT